MTIFLFIIGLLPAQAQERSPELQEPDNIPDSILRQRLGLGPEMTYKVIHGWVVAAAGDRSLHNSTWHGKLTPLLLSRAVTIQDMKGNPAGPVEGRYVGHLGDGVLWTSDNAELSRFCTYPYEVKGGTYSLLRNGAEPIHDLEDISPYWDHGLGLVRRGGKVALVDSLLQLRTPFEYDQALVNPAYQYKRFPAMPPQLWVCALRGSDGEWKIVDAQGNLQETDWPASYEPDEAGINIRVDQGDWLYFYRNPELECFGHIPREDRPQYSPDNLSHHEVFPNEVRRSQFCDSIRVLKLGEVGLELRYRKGLVALAHAGGKRLTGFGNDRFEPAGEGWVRRIRMVPEPVKTEEFVEFEEAEEFAVEEDFETTIDDGQNEPEPSHLVEKVGMIHQGGKKEIPCDYKEVRVLSDWHLIMAVTEDSGTFYDLEGNLLKVGSPFHFNWSDEQLGCWTFGKESLVWDRTGKMLYSDTTYIRGALLEGDWIWIDAGETEGFTAYSINGSGQVRGPVLCTEYPNAAYRFQQAHPEIACEGCYLDSLDQRYWRIATPEGVGITGAQGKWVIAPSAGFQWVTPLTEGFEVVKDNLRGYANSKGEVLIQPQFFSVSDLGGGRIQLTRLSGNSAEYAEIDAEGKIVRDWH